jgi:branched-chain amino acid aminotransferase
MLWLAGKLVPAKDATVPAMSPTVQYGLNVFEVVRCYLSADGKELLPFRLDEHLKRLFQSCKILQLIPSLSIEEVKAALAETIKANRYFEDMSARIVFYVNSDGSWTNIQTCDLMIAPVTKGRVYAPGTGITCCVSSWERISDRSIAPRAKAGANYLNSRMAQLEALTNGYDTAIFLNREGKVAEAPGSCIFMVRDNKLVTPPITASILESISRDAILQIAQVDLGMEVEVRDIDRTELYISEEVFLCGTTIEIAPVLSIDHLPITPEGPGPLTTRLINKFFEIARGQSGSHPDWIAPLAGL